MSMICTLYAVSEQAMGDLLANPESIHDFISVESESKPQLSLEKTWHGLHFLLTGSAWEGDNLQSFLVSGGEEVGDIDLGYGPARILRPGQVRQLHELLSPLTSEALRKRFDPPKMMEEGIYPSIWDRNPEEDDTLGELIEYFKELKVFIQTASQNGNGIVITLG